MTIDMDTECKYMQCQKDCMETFNRFIDRKAKQHNLSRNSMLEVIMIANYGYDYTREEIGQYLYDNFALNLYNQDAIIKGLDE